MKLSVKKFSKKSLSLLIALIMVFSALPLTPPISADAAQAINFENPAIGYTGSDYAVSYHYNDGSNSNKYSFALSTFEAVSGTTTCAVLRNGTSGNGTVTVQRGKPLYITQNFGKYISSGTKPTNGPGWYYGNNSNYSLRLFDYCKVYVDGQNSGNEVQTGVKDGTLNNNGTSQTTFTVGNTACTTTDATVKYIFDNTQSRANFLNTVGTYTMNIYTPIGLCYKGSKTDQYTYYNSSNANHRATITIKVVDGFTVKFMKSDGTTVIEERKISFGNQIGAFPSNSSASVDTVVGDKAHNVYTWNTTLTSEFVPTSDITITEKATLTAHSIGTPATCTTQAVCSVCGVEYGSLGEHTFNNNRQGRQNPDDFNNGFTYTKCDNCDEIKSDSKIFDNVKSNWDAYIAQLEVCETKLANTAKYTADSIASVRSKVDKIKTDVEDNGGVYDDSKSWKYIDRQTESLMTALTKLEIAKYSVTLRFKNENGVNVTNPEDSKSYKVFENVPYGDVTLAEVPTALEESGYSVYKWIRIDGNNDVLSGLNSNSLNVMVKKNMEYWVYLKKTAVDDSQASGKAVVTINNKSNKVYDIGYIDLNENTAVSVSSNNITIGGVTLTAPVYSFYNITGFNINGKIVTGTDTVSITKDTVIKPVYEPTLDAFIKRAENETFLINGKAEDLSVKWNQKVILNTIDGAEVAWIAGIDRDGNGTIDSKEKNVVGYGSSYSFYANSNVTFYTESITVGDPKTSIGLFSYNANENKVTLVNNFYAPSGYTVKYAGVVLSTKTDNRDKLIEQTNGRFFGGESDFSGTDSNKNQLRISVTRTATTSFDMHALAYIIVQKPNGKEETVYADNVETIHYTATA